MFVGERVATVRNDSANAEFQNADRINPKIGNLACLFAEILFPPPLNHRRLTIIISIENAPKPPSDLMRQGAHLSSFSRLEVTTTV
jgi:hypothetical protein